MARDPTEMQMRVFGSTDDDEICPTGLREDLDLGRDLAGAAGEVPADIGNKELLGDISSQSLVTVCVREQRDGREETPDGCCSGQVRHKASVHTGLIAHGKADGHGEGAVARC